jgi:CBS domain-containing protein
MKIKVIERKVEVIEMSEKTFSENARKKCSEIMTRNVRTANRETTLRDVAVLMRDGDMGSMPVVEDGKLVGIVTDRDIVIRAIADGKDASSAIGDVMTAEVFAARENDFVFEAIRLMGDKQVRRVPIINDSGELVGIIAMADVALETEDEREIAETLEEISSGSAFWSKN